MTSKRPHLSKGIYCIKCDACICKPRYKKYPDPDFNYEMLCAECSDDKPLLRAFNRLRKAMFNDELDAFMEFLNEMHKHAKEAEEYCQSMRYENPGYNESGENVRKSVEIILNNFKESLELIEGRNE